MKFLARLLAGNVALWLTFWLVGLPLSLVLDGAGTCMVLGCGITEQATINAVIALFAVASVAVVLASIAIWRSASNYPRPAWWNTAIAIAAKLCAAFSIFAAGLSFLAVVYFAVEYIFPGLLPF